MRRWIDIGSDVNWPDYGGKWARRAKDGSWYVVDFCNMYEACGESDCKRDGQSQYVCEVRRVNLAYMRPETLKSALACSGFRMTAEGLTSDQGDLVDAAHTEATIVEACASYGASERLESFSGDHYPARIRAETRRYAETCMQVARPARRVAAENIMRKIHGLPPGES